MEFIKSKDLSPIIDKIQVLQKRIASLIKYNNSKH